MVENGAFRVAYDSLAESLGRQKLEELPSTVRVMLVYAEMRRISQGRREEAAALGAPRPEIKDEAQPHPVAMILEVSSSASLTAQVATPAMQVDAEAEEGCTATERRRPGRRYYQNPALVKLLRGSAEHQIPTIQDEERGRDDLRPASGILLSGLLGLMLWITVGAAVWLSTQSRDVPSLRQIEMPSLPLRMGGG